MLNKHWTNCLFIWRWFEKPFLQVSISFNTNELIGIIFRMNSQMKLHRFSSRNTAKSQESCSCLCLRKCSHSGPSCFDKLFNFVLQSATVFVACVACLNSWILSCWSMSWHFWEAARKLWQIGRCIQTRRQKQKLFPASTGGLWAHTNECATFRGVARIDAQKTWDIKLLSARDVR